ncbi:MAG: hypothetical protein RIS88_531 [Pseudomonadota bacterium]|jgi:NAD(P)-dependent dehydrogenase (short-subunit alcohol dehydrogenase family)
MQASGKIAIVTGGASGIGEGLARRLAQEGARGVVLADRDLAKAQSVAREIGPQALALRCDVSREADLQDVVATTAERFGPVDIFCSNAGILGRPGGFELEDPVWDSMWQIHLMAHVWAARAVVPGMVARGEGYFLVTASAAGLLNIVETAPYAVTKHAAVAFAEWLRIAYGRRGVRVSCLCPQGVDTEMTRGGAGSAGHDGVLTTAQVADVVIQTMREETFLALPHPSVLQYMQAKVRDYDRWLGGMQKLYGQHGGGGA